MTMKCLMCGKQKPQDEMMKSPHDKVTAVCHDCMGKASQKLAAAMKEK